MFKNLKAELARNDKTYTDVAGVIAVNSKTITNKMAGKTEWTLKEMNLIKKEIFPECSIDYLFAISE